MRSLYGAFCPDEDEVEVRCLLVMSLFVGSPLIDAGHGPRTRADVMALALRRLEAQVQGLMRKRLVFGAPVFPVVLFATALSW